MKIQRSTPIGSSISNHFHGMLSLPKVKYIVGYQTVPVDTGYGWRHYTLGKQTWQLANSEVEQYDYSRHLVVAALWSHDPESWPLWCSASSCGSSVFDGVFIYIYMHSTLIPAVPDLQQKFPCCLSVVTD